MQRFVPDDWRDKWLHLGRVGWGRAWIGIVLCRKNERRNTRTKNKGTNRDNLLRLSSNHTKQRLFHVFGCWPLTMCWLAVRVCACCLLMPLQSYPCSTPFQLFFFPYPQRLRPYPCPAPPYPTRMQPFVPPVVRDKSLHLSVDHGRDIRNHNTAQHSTAQYSTT